LSVVEIGTLLACALVGWLVVSWVITLVRQQREPPVIGLPESRQLPVEDAGSRRPSLREIAETWPAVLRVRADASVEEINRAYHERLAECDAVRFSKDVGNSERREAEEQRLRIDEAYNFIRTSRGPS
jgi:preprotein translocase subunit Sec63